MGLPMSKQESALLMLKGMPAHLFQNALIPEQELLQEFQQLQCEK